MSNPKKKKKSNFRTLYQPNQCIQNLILRIIKLKANIRIEGNAKNNIEVNVINYKHRY